MLDRWHPGQRDSLGNPLRLCRTYDDCPYGCSMILPHLHSIIRPEHRRGSEIVIHRAPAGVAPDVLTWYAYCLQCGTLHREPATRTRAWELRDEHVGVSGHNVTGVRPWS